MWAQMVVTTVHSAAKGFILQAIEYRGPLQKRSHTHFTGFAIHGIRGLLATIQLLIIHQIFHQFTLFYT